MSELTADVVRKLRQPFAPEHIRWKVQANPKEGKDMAVVVVFVDARTVAAHLDDIVPGEWSSSYHQPPVTVGLPALECRLTICGVTRVDVGTVEPDTRKQGSETKDLYSDALKRAAVQYGVGAFLYRFPQVSARVEKFGNTWYITPPAQAELKQLAEAVVAGRPLPRFSHLSVRGYNPDGVSSVTGMADAEQPAAPQRAPAEATATIGEEKASKLHRALGNLLKGTEWEGKHAEWVAQQVGRTVEHLRDLTPQENNLLGVKANAFKQARLSA